MEALTIGVEEELAVVDCRRHMLVGRAGEVIDGLPEHLKGFVDHEMKSCQLETVTPVCADLDELHHRLHDLRTGVARTAQEIGCELLAAGTHPASSWEDQSLTQKSAYAALEQDYQRLANEQVLFGCHVHVGVPDPDLRIAALDRVRPWLAPMLALTANSPFWDGDDTGYASYRYVMFSRWPTFVTPDVLGDWAGFERLVESFVEGGVIDSPKRLYWTARPSGRYPTIEFRITDVCQTVDEAVMVAGIARALVATAIEEERAGFELPQVRSEAFRVSEWQAARYGTSDELLDPVGGCCRPAADAIDELIDHVTPALRAAGDLDVVTDAIDRILREGTGADRQRRALGDDGDVDALLRSLLVRTAEDSTSGDVAADWPSVEPSVDLTSTDGHGLPTHRGLGHQPLEEPAVGSVNG